MNLKKSGWVKCASTCRENKWFYHHAARRLTVLQDFVTDKWCVKDQFNTSIRGPFVTAEQAMLSK